jgi:hypothetical protein
MDAELWEFSLPPNLLQRGFWLYVWKIRGPNDEPLCYVGMTGDVTLVAQSPFNRAGAHLGLNKNNNALRRALRQRDISPERCTELCFLAYGPIYDSADTKNFKDNRRNVAALERALWDALKRDGFDPVNNRPKSRSDYDVAIFTKIRSAFARHFAG